MPRTPARHLPAPGTPVVTLRIGVQTWLQLLPAAAGSC